MDLKSFVADSFLMLDGGMGTMLMQAGMPAGSLPERTQGLCLSSDGRVILSASSAFGASQLYLYDVRTVAEGRRGICFWDKSHPVPLV